MIALGLETSCDETACGIVRDGRKTLSNIVRSQVKQHAPFGGVVPEIASRAHVADVLPVVRLAMAEAQVTAADIDIVCVASRPGLIGALLVGLTAAKALAMAWDKPLVPVDHLHAHIIGATLDREDLTFPAVCLVVSGGHTTLLDAKTPWSIGFLGGTTDDAAGEAFDKVAQILSLGYPGGPAISAAAASGNAQAIAFPRPLLGRDSLDFSFSGLKTAVRYKVLGQQGKPPAVTHPKSDVAASFQAAVVETLTEKCRRALVKTGHQHLIVGGGVAANRCLRASLADMAEKAGCRLTIAEPAFCTDNGAMAAALGAMIYDRTEAGPARDAFKDLSVEASAHSALLYGE